MAKESLAARKRTGQIRTKVKTGCATCRIRKVKCDETKPSCQKCVSTGRTCDGYESPFRLLTSQSLGSKPGLGAGHNSGRPGAGGGGGTTKPGSAAGGSSMLLPTNQPTFLSEIAPQDIDLLNRCFSTKTMFETVRLGCNEEARQILQASLTDPLIRHAVTSLRALRGQLDASGEVTPSVAASASAAVQMEAATPGGAFDYGVQQYCKALGGLASNLSSPGPSQLKSALFCCQIFISIEQVRGNYGTMAQHIGQGLRILHEYKARPQFDATTNKIVPAHHQGQLPLIDVFIVKLFAAPCKFADRPPPPAPPATPATPATSTSNSSASAATTPASACPLGLSPLSQTTDESWRSSPTSTSHSSSLRALAPDMRTELTRISTAAIAFLDKVTRVESAGSAPKLLAEKTSLLKSLESWLGDLELVQADIAPPGQELISVSFLRFFHQTLRIVLLGTFDAAPDLCAQLRAETYRLQDIAGSIDERVQSYKMQWN